MLRYSRFDAIPVEGYPYLFAVMRETEGTELIDTFREAGAWCIDRFGPRSASPDGPIFGGPGDIHEDAPGAESGRWFCSLLVFGFRDERDAFEFKMRWS